MKSRGSTGSSRVSLKCLANFVSSMNTYGAPVMCLRLGGEGGMRTQTEALSYSLGAPSCVWWLHWGSSFMNWLLGPRLSLAERLGRELPLRRHVLWLGGPGVRAQESCVEKRESSWQGRRKGNPCSLSILSATPVWGWHKIFIMPSLAGARAMTTMVSIT